VDVRAVQGRTAQVGPSQVGSVEHRTGQVAAEQVRPGQVGVRQVGLAQPAAGQVDTGQHGAAQRHLRQVVKFQRRPHPAGMIAGERRMRSQDVVQPLLVGRRLHLGAGHAGSWVTGRAL